MFNENDNEMIGYYCGLIARKGGKEFKGIVRLQEWKHGTWIYQNHGPGNFYF